LELAKVLFPDLAFNSVYRGCSKFSVLQKQVKYPFEFEFDDIWNRVEPIKIDGKLVTSF
jgi:hypothetical protein